MIWKISLEQIELMLRVGVLPHERERPQRILIDLEIEAEYQRPPESISECVDYSKIYEYLGKLEEKPHTELLETLAHEVSSYVLREFGQVKNIVCVVAKPEIFKNAKNVSVSLTMSRNIPLH